MAVVGLVVLFSERLDLRKEAVSSDNSESVTGSFLNFAKGNCDSSSTRPCYDKQTGTGKKVIGLEPRGGEKAFAACLKNAAPNDYGVLTLKTSKCDAEQLNYCYDGRSTTMLRKFEGQCINSKPSSNIDCPSIPFIEFVSGVEEGWDSRTINLGLRTIFSSKSGALYVGGMKYVATGTIPSYKYVANVYKSVDNGISWVGVSLPSGSLIGYTHKIIEDSTGALYAAGSSLWKSTDGGSTWSIISPPNTDTTGSALTSDVLQSKDGSLIALEFKHHYPADNTQPSTYSNEVYKSYDGGKTWQFILKPDFQYFNTYTNSYQPGYSLNFIEANDGSLIFSTDGGIYLYSSGALTKIIATDRYGLSIDFLKAMDGTIYFIAGNPEKPNGPLVSYQSTDNGRTWVKTGELPYSRIVGIDEPIESSDGSIWAIAYTDCWQSTIYKSNDKGASWSPAATAPPNVFVEYDVVSFVGPKIVHIAESGGKIYSVPFGFGAVFSVP